MKTKWGSVSRGFYFGFAGLVVLACMTAIGWNTISAYAKNTRSGIVDGLVLHVAARGQQCQRSRGG